MGEMWVGGGGDYQLTVDAAGDQNLCHILKELLPSPNLRCGFDTSLLTPLTSLFSPLDEWLPAREREHHISLSSMPLSVA